MTSLAPLNGPNLRAFFEGKGTVAQNSNNMTSKTIDPLHYQAVVNMNTNERRPLKIGDRIEIEAARVNGAITVTKIGKH